MEEIQKENQQMIDGFILNKKQIDNITNEESLKNLKRFLEKFNREINKPFNFYKNIEQQDILKFIDHYKITTKPVIIARIKEFCRFIHKLEKDDKLPDSIRKIKPPSKKQIQKIQPPNITNKIITSEEYNLLINDGTTHPMDKAIAETLYLFGCRPAELTSMNVSCIKEDTNTGITTITVLESKTKPRDIPINENPQFLLDWLHVYCANKNKPEAPLWTSRSDRNTGERLTAHAIYTIITRMAKTAGLERKIHPYMLRHTSVTRDRQKDIPITHLESKFGWEHGTQMLKTYDNNNTEDLKKYLIHSSYKKPETYASLQKDKSKIDKLEENNKKLNTEIEHLRNIFKNQLTVSTEKAVESIMTTICKDAKTEEEAINNLTMWITVFLNKNKDKKNTN